LRFACFPEAAIQFLLIRIKINEKGKVEQSNGTLERCLNAKLAETESDDWVSALPYVQYAMNISMQNTTKTAPYNIVFGQHPNMGKYL